MRIKNKDTLVSHGNIEGRKIVADLLDAGLDSLDPYYRGQNHSNQTESDLNVGLASFQNPRY